MSELAFAQDALQSRIAPPSSAQFVSQRIKLAASRLGWRYSRVRDVWYGDERVSLKARELREIEQATGVEYARQELRTNDALLAQAEALAMGQDQTFYRAFVAALRSALGAVDRT